VASASEGYGCNADHVAIGAKLLAQHVDLSGQIESSHTAKVMSVERVRTARSR
jgi:hypothetical protein